MVGILEDFDQYSSIMDQKIKDIEKNRGMFEGQEEYEKKRVDIETKKKADLMANLSKNFRNELNFTATMHTARIQITSYRILIKAHTLDLFPEVNRVRFNAFCPEKKQVLFIHYNAEGQTEKLIYELDCLNYCFNLKK